MIMLEKIDQLEIPHSRSHWPL